MSKKSQKMQKTDAHVAALLVAEKVVSKQQVATALKTIAPDVQHVLDHHNTPDGDDCQKMVSIWTDAAWLTIIMSAFNWTGTDIRKNVFQFRTTHKPQRKTPNEYLPLKSHVKLAAVAVALVTHDASAYRNSNKYLGTLVALPEVTGQSEIENEKVYTMYGNVTESIERFCDSIDNAEFRDTMKSKALWKSPSTASTQRPTSAWILQMFGAGENRGNDKTIVVDRSSEFYQSLKSLFFNV